MFATPAPTGDDARHRLCRRSLCRTARRRRGNGLARGRGRRCGAQEGKTWEGGETTGKERGGEEVEDNER